MSDANYINPLVEEAVACFNGSQSKLARAVGGRCRQGHVYKWLRQKQVTGEVAVKLDRATGGRVPKERFRPDLFDAADQQQAA